MPDVDVPTSWPLMLQGNLWARTGPAAAIKDGYGMLLSGGVIWRDPAARDYWGRIIRDPRFTGHGPAGPGDRSGQATC